MPPLMRVVGWLFRVNEAQGLVFPGSLHPAPGNMLTLWQRHPFA